VKGLSRAQLGLLVVLAIILLGTLIAVLLQEWVVAAGAAVISFGLFAVLVVFTLTALTGSVRRLGELSRATAPRVRETAAAVRRVDQRTAERFKTLDTAGARLEAAERRVLAAFEDHRQRVEDSVAEAFERNDQR
jgi:hypothetical protein